MHIVEAKAGQHIVSFADELVDLAWRMKITVLGEFNQYTLEARPGWTREQVLREWNDAQKSSYFGSEGT